SRKCLESSTSRQRRPTPHRMPDETRRVMAGSRNPSGDHAPTRVAVADDDVLLREGLASLLERAGFDVVGQCGDATELIALVQELVAARRINDPLEGLSPREREVLALMAEGRSNAGIARQLWVTEGTVEKHVHSVLQKLRLPETQDDHRRVLAVIAYLEAR